MPQAVPAIIGIGKALLFSAGLSSGVAYAVSSFVVKTALLTAASAAINSLLPRPDVPSFEDPGRQLRFAPDASAPRATVYGETLVTGQPVYVATNGADRVYLDMIVAIGDGGPFESIEAVYFNDEELTIVSNAVTAPSQYSGFASIYTDLGSESTTGISQAITNLTEWTSNHAGKGVCHAYVRLEWDAEVWSTGQPTIYFNVRGRKVYDPRLDSTEGGSGSHRKDDETTWEWSDNRALWLLDYMRGVKSNGRRIIGMGLDDTLINWSSFQDAADVCEETMSIKPSGTIEKYTGGGALVSSADDPAGVVNGMLACMAGRIAPRSGFVSLFAGAVQTSVVTLTDDDLAGPIKVQIDQSLRSISNTMTASYRDPSEGYEIVDAPAFTDATLVSADGETLPSAIGLPFEDDYRRAQRLAKIALYRSRARFRIEATYKMKAMQLGEGEAFTVSSDRLPSEVAGKFICVSRVINEDGTVQVIGISQDDTMFDWTASSEEQDRTAGGSITNNTDTFTLGGISPPDYRRTLLAGIPQPTLWLQFEDGSYDVNLTGAAGFEDSFNLGGGFIRDSGGNALGDSDVLNTAVTLTNTGVLNGAGGGAITNLDAGNIGTGTFANARVAASNVTQHEGSITISNLAGTATAGQIPSLDASKIGSGVFAGARVAGIIADASINSSSPPKVKSLDFPSLSDTMTDTTVGTTETVIMEVQFTSVGDANLIWFNQTFVSFDSPGADDAGEITLRVRYSSSSGDTSGTLLKVVTVNAADVLGTIEVDGIGLAANEIYSLELSGTVYVAITIQVTGSPITECYVDGGLSAMKVHGIGEIDG